MTWLVKYKFLLRLLVAYSIMLIIKGFDHSFGHIAHITWRGQYFSLLFLLIWMATWYLAEAMHTRSRHLKQAFKLGIHLAIGYTSGFATNMAYKYSDIYLFNNQDTWIGIPDYNPELTLSLLILYMLIYATSSYVSSLLQIKEAEIKSVQLAKENMQAQYKSLKAQIEPHFLFNSLSVLSSILHSDTELASEYIVKLSKTLRFIIEKNAFTLVPLKEEIQLINNYFFLLKIRFGSKVSLHIESNVMETNSVYIPPATLQLLLENAVKHNKFSESEPLRIGIGIDETYIHVTNSLNKRQRGPGSTHVGLNNIKQRYMLIAQSAIFVEETTQSFCVKLPILNRMHHESFNH